MNDLSVGRSVGASVRAYLRLSSALWKNGGSDPDAVWYHRSDGSRDEADSGVRGSVHGKGYFWGRIWGAPLYPMGTLRRMCTTVPQPSELRFGVVRAVGRGIAVLDGGPRSPTGRGGFWGLFSIFTSRRYASAALAVIVSLSICLSVRLPVRLSQVGVVQR